MPVNYGKQIQKTGAAIGTIIAAPKPANYNSSTDNWNLATRFPGYLECDGSALNPNQYFALYQVIGMTYGGNVTGSYPNYSGTFNLPNFRGKYVLGTGQVDGNSGASGGVTPSLTASGNLGGSFNEAGTVGGQYVINTVRQLPSGSEITPSTPSSPQDIGGSATDTFEIGTYRTTGFSTSVARPNATISGNVSFTAGPLKTTKIFGAMPHGHVLTHCRLINSTTAGSTRDGGPGGPDKMPVYQAVTGGIVSFNRFVQNAGGSGDGATATVTVSGGTITSVNVTNGGSGYVSAPGIVLSGGNPSAEAILTANINASGSVTSVTINFGGSGFSSTPTLTFVPSSSAPLRSHSHKLHELGPSTATWGHDDGSGNEGSQDASYQGVQPGASDAADSKTKTLGIFSDLGVELNEGSLVMNDSSRTLFDSRLQVKLTSAEEIPVMETYFRTKYLIKAI
jgi:microcystin-dependent protein